MPRALITGSDGFIGRALVPALAARGFEPRCALMEPLDQPGAREPAAAAVLRAFECVTVGDIGPGTDWSSALRGVDVVYHLAGRAHVLHETSTDPLSEFRRVNTAATVQLAECAANAGIGRFVFISSIGVHGSVNRDGPFTESSPIVPDKPYALSKHEAECALHALSERTGLDVAVVRPPLIYGPWVRGNFRRMLDWAYRGLPLPLGAVRNARTFIALDNLVDALIACGSHDRAAGQTFVAGDHDSLSTSELLRTIAAHLDRPSRLVPVPISLLRAAAAALGRREDAERLLGSLVVDSSHLRTTLNWQPNVSVDEGLARMCDWYLHAVVQR